MNVFALQPEATQLSHVNILVSVLFSFWSDSCQTNQAGQGMGGRWDGGGEGGGEGGEWKGGTEGEKSALTSE